MFNSESFILFVSIATILILLTGTLTLTNLFVRATRKFWTAAYRLMRYFILRTRGYNQSDALRVTLRH
ncbi:MAG: hypothetical protein LBT80_03435 [Lactobacillaceae bacterium]|jgi:hypothetical protein|nr:hypothetical protein [Lactobacillaceae bacterium]